MFVLWAASVLVLLASFGIERLIGNAHYLLDTGLSIFALLSIGMVAGTWAALISDRIADRVWQIIEHHRVTVSILGGTGVVFYGVMIICLVVYGPGVR
jgi:hypothetical protein